MTVLPITCILTHQDVRVASRCAGCLRVRRGELVRLLHDHPSFEVTFVGGVGSVGGRSRSASRICGSSGGGPDPGDGTGRDLGCRRPCLFGVAQRELRARACDPRRGARVIDLRATSASRHPRIRRGTASSIRRRRGSGRPRTACPSCSPITSAVRRCREPRLFRHRGDPVAACRCSPPASWSPA